MGPQRVRFTHRFQLMFVARFGIDANEFVTVRSVHKQRELPAAGHVWRARLQSCLPHLLPDTRLCRTAAA
jgi:hypothetical protein